jgi:hypothetical protein
MGLTGQWRIESLITNLIPETTLETSGEDVKNTLETSGEDVKNTLETSGEDRKNTLERVEKM